jgi:hypothetical protein
MPKWLLCDADDYRRGIGVTLLAWAWLKRAAAAQSMGDLTSPHADAPALRREAEDERRGGPGHPHGATGRRLVRQRPASSPSVTMARP